MHIMRAVRYLGILSFNEKIVARERKTLWKKETKRDEESSHRRGSFISHNTLEKTQGKITLCTPRPTHDIYTCMHIALFPSEHVEYVIVEKITEEKK